MGDRTTLNELFELLRRNLAPICPQLRIAEPLYGEFRAGDVQHSQADIGKAIERLGYQPSQRVAEGLAQAMRWYTEHSAPR